MKYFIAFLSFLMAIEVCGQLNSSYQIPHADIMTLADATPAPSILMDDKAQNALLLYSAGYKTIEELSIEEVRLGGLRMNPKTTMSERSRFSVKVSLLDPKTQKESAIAGMPENGSFSSFLWSPDQNYVAFLNTSTDGVELWAAHIPTKIAKKLSDANVHAGLGRPMIWMSDSQHLLVKMRHQGQVSIVNRNAITPSGPTISENAGQKAQNRTYQDLLKNPTDEENFHTLATSKIVKIDLNGQVSDFLPAAIYDDLDLSPDGKYVLVTTIKRPFSYIVPYDRFPTDYDLYTSGGEWVKKQFSTPLMEEMPKGFMATTVYPRSVRWRADKPANLVWVQALDNGDPEVSVDHRDAVYQLAAPFTGERELVVKTKERYAGVSWGNDQMAVVYERWWNTRNARTLLFDPSNTSKEPTLINERNYQDEYSNPGSFVTKKNEYGYPVLEFYQDQLYLLGGGYSEAGKFPFFDRYDPKTGATVRLYQAKDQDKLENLLGVLDISKGQLLTRIESQTDYPNYYTRNINTGKISSITAFENPFEILNGVHKEIIQYKREDGLDLSATLYLPVGYDKSKMEKMPMIMWAYPREFKDQATASQNTSSSNEFTFPSWGSPIYWVNRGYVVLDRTAFPIVGEGTDEPNDSFVEQLVANAKAAIDAVDNLGYIDRNKVAVGGHSYGAFMTANLLTHCDLFAAGIARSGAYNRTLTPFGFQSEERSYWEAPDVYNTMSPFMNAHKMKTPLLLVHGEADNNSGTYPMQSERYFNALKGLGATVRLVMLPKESHGYAAKESIMHLLWEQDNWLDKYVKNKPALKEVKP